MMRSHRRRLAGFVAAAALWPAAVRAQATAQSFDDLPRVLRAGQTVVVTDTTGHRVKGKVDRLSPASITVGGRTLADSSVRELRLPDRLWNGMLTGAAIGTGLAAWDYLIDPSEPGNGAIFTVAIGLGAAIGAGVDAVTARSGRLVYASRRKTAPVQVVPVITRQRQGVRVRIRF